MPPSEKETKMMLMDEKESYSWYDPIVDPPIPVRRKERKALKGHQLAGMGIGALGGAALAALGYKSGFYDVRPKGGDPNALASIGLGAGVGGLLGDVAGTYMGNRAIMKERLRRGEPLSDPREEAQKLKSLRASYPISVKPKPPGSLISSS